MEALHLLFMGKMFLFSEVHLLERSFFFDLKSPEYVHSFSLVGKDSDDRGDIDLLPHIL